MRLLAEKLAAGYRLILGSGSPRRRQILTDCGLPFVIAQPFDTQEVWPPEMPAEKVAEYLAELKSEAYSEPLQPGDILLTADTTVVLDGRVLGKPVNLDDAREMLKSLSERTHEVITGVALRQHADGGGMKFQPTAGGGGGLSASPSTLKFSVQTSVRFRELTTQEIDYYVDTFRPLDKAGAYGIQEWIGLVGVEHIEGSFHNVMGLPIQRIYSELLKLV